MHRWGALGAGLLTWLLVGCAAGPPVKSTSWLKRLPFGAAGGPEYVGMEVALLECPVGDVYINRDLWTLADELVVEPERKAALEGNGFRVAQVGGLIPAELQALLTSKRSNADPRQRRVLTGHPATLPLGPQVSELSFQVVQDGEPVSVKLAQAQCRLLVVPGRAAEGKVRLQFTPQVEYGERKPDFHPAADGSGWVMQVERPSKTYPALSWEVSLAPGQYVVVGARFDQPRSLGYACFVQADSTKPVQRLLVIRTTATEPVREGPAGGEEADKAVASRPPPLAVLAQTPYFAARGSCR